MESISYAGNKTLYVTLLLVLWPVTVATIVGLVVGLVQTVTQLQEQTLPFGIKLLAVGLCMLLLSGWSAEVLMEFSREVFALALR
ncbi:type III secretion protein S [Cupriavidus sp. YR651]|uniref:EscS/YscS/HrcS family type III secretion system export apparatus protein n=1 Tax=Cupriavidus sp. YR651 TaxID=1855315 RepID=UPI00088404CC|nr:EscS/YscS/HrcS family type III secretion system export apparatus protein [Cupriavidus sp. YR651]SDD38587.1 type III secretion protein S [Cupriavidus sp. YR651]